MKFLKKVLSFLGAILLALFSCLGYFIWDRYSRNSIQLIPFPYELKAPTEAIEVNAPIALIGDRMGQQMAKFIPHLAQTISTNLIQPIKIQALTQDGFGLHRTLHQLEHISTWPQILIYQGGSEEFLEKKFDLTFVKDIRTNFKFYRDERLQTLLTLYPWFSRLIYFPIKKISLSDSPTSQNLTPEEYLKILEIELILFEEHLKKLISLCQKSNALLILTTTPVNLDSPPKKVCPFTENYLSRKELKEVREMLVEDQPKRAYQKSSNLVSQHLGNAHFFYLHGQVAKRLGEREEARTHLLKSSAYDCTPWRATEVQNSIIRKVAAENQVMLFDFARLVERDFARLETFSDELYPKESYYEKAMEQLGAVIKNILKL